MLRLRLQKTKRICEADFNITNVQDDHSEIVLSSGRICLDLLQTQKTGSHKGNLDTFVGLSFTSSQCCKKLLKLKIKKQSHKSFAQKLSRNLSSILLSRHWYVLMNFIFVLAIHSVTCLLQGRS